jgi:ribosomal protein L40E
MGELDPEVAKHTTLIRERGPVAEPKTAVAGVCTRCGAKVDTDTGWCRACLRGEDERRRTLALEQASQRCVECGVVYVGVALDRSGRCHHCAKAAA